MRYYPINLVLENKKCVVVGAGAVALRKVQQLLNCDARVLLVGPGAVAGLKSLSKNKKIIHRDRKFNLSDLAGAYLVIAATSDREVNSSVYSYCCKNNILVNVVDCPKECSFILPSVVRRGGLTIGISTDGASPALAKKIRQDLEKLFGAEYAKLTRIMQGLRVRIKKIDGAQARDVFFKKAFAPNILNLLKANKDKEVKSILNGWLVAYGV